MVNMLIQGLRLLLALFYLAGGAFHLAMIRSDRLELYQAFADHAVLAFYSTAWEALVVPALPWIILPVILFLWTAAILMLCKGGWARAGQGLGILWNLFLAPFGPWGWTNLILAALHGWLFTRHFRSGARAWLGAATPVRRRFG